MTELMKWISYFDRRRGENDKEDWRMASVVTAIYNTQGGKTKITDHLLRFEKKKKTQREEYDSKSTWLACLGLNPENPYEPAPTSSG